VSMARSKYRNVRTEYRGVPYDSKAEAERQAADIRGYEGVTDVTIEPESCIVDEAPSADPGARLDL